MKTLIEQIQHQFYNIHRGRNWFGQSYLTKLQDMDASHYFTRPQPEVHSVAELISHGTAWRKDAVVKIKTGKGELTEMSPDDWPDLESLKKKGWEKIFEEYTESVDTFLALLQQKDDEFLETEYIDPEFGGKYPYSFTINGILQHDLYHLGQLGLVIRMLRESN